MLSIGIIATGIFGSSQAFAVYPCPDPYCPNTPPGYQYEDFKLKYAPTVCEVEPKDTRFPNLAQLVITTTHLGIQNWVTQLNNGSGKNPVWNMNEIIMPPSNQINLDPACNIAIVYESQELDYCGQIYNGVYFACGQIFNGITIPNSQTNTAVVFIPYLMPIYGEQCEYEKNNVSYDMVCRSQQAVESQSRFLKAIEHEIGHSMGLGHFIADSQDEVGRWIAGTESVPSIMVSGEEGQIEYAKVTALDANEIRSIYGIGGFDTANSTGSENMQYQDDLKLQSSQRPIPQWIKNVAMWWSQGQLSDPEFEECIKYLVQQGIVVIHTTGHATSHVQEVPAWLKEVAEWWGTGNAGDTYFASVIQWIV